MKKVFCLLWIIVISVNSYGQVVESETRSKMYSSKEEMIAKLQIPDDVLKTMSTDSLLDKCLNYPFLLDILMYESFEKGFKQVTSDFNGFKELFIRKNLVDAAINEASKFPARNTLLQKAGKRERGGYSIRYFVLEYIMSQKFFIDNLNESQRKDLGVILMTILR